MTADPNTQAHTCANAFTQHPGKCAHWCSDERTCKALGPGNYRGWSSVVYEQPTPVAEPASEPAPAPQEKDTP